MAAFVPISTYTLTVVPGIPTSAIDEDFPLSVRITMAALDPSPLDDKKVPSTLRILKRPADLSDMGEWIDDEASEDDEEDEEEEEEEEEEEKPKKGKKAEPKTNGKKKAEDVEMEDEEEEEGDEEDEDEDSDEDEFEIETVVVCTLSPETLYQQPLDLIVNADEEILFEVTGSYNVSLIGNYVELPTDAHDSDDSDDYDSDEDYDLSPDEDELLEGLSEEDELDSLDDEEEAAGRIEAIESEEEEEKPKKEVKKAAKNANGKRQKEDEEEKTLDDLIEKDAKPAEKLTKAQKKKLKAADGSAAPAPSEKDKGDKKVTFNKNLEQGPTGSGAPGNVKKVQTLQGGLTVEDRTLGEGAGAKNGQKVGVRYIGKLNNGKVFDSNTKGKPFFFTLGKGEVIKGWDIGVKGMAVKGERRIIIPAALAYGKKALPGIPANSQLTFDVKLVSIN
ncbi:uncharacterized protein V1510DRAFT_416841 [Dipodascopsis tothii]|uniref:uncharacterized protein n=1 Tax=Dipodascopsis tothii TaxID=44089 RepID=UPI0034CF5348